jgi:tetratricopeptide (TPR) repeat protein
MHPSSIAHFERMLQEEPANPVFHYMMGNELRKLALLDQAVDAFRKAVQLRIDHLGVYLVLSETLEALGRFEEAIEALETGIEEAKRRDYELAELHLRGCLEQLRMRRG